MSSGLKLPTLLFCHHASVDCGVELETFAQGHGKYIVFDFQDRSALRAGNSVIWKSMVDAVCRTTAPYARGTMPLGITKICPKETEKETEGSLVSGVRCALTVLHASGQATLSREGN